MDRTEKQLESLRKDLQYRNENNIRLIRQSNNRIKSNITGAAVAGIFVCIFSAIIRSANGKSAVLPLIVLFILLGIICYVWTVYSAKLEKMITDCTNNAFPENDETDEEVP